MRCELEKIKSRMWFEDVFALQRSFAHKTRHVEVMLSALLK
jgi:hypothetical protein